MKRQTLVAVWFWSVIGGTVLCFGGVALGFVRPAIGPTVLAAGMACSMTGLALTRAIRRKLRNEVLAANYQLCPECEYSLKSLPAKGRCPECGRPYDSSRLEEDWKSKKGIGSI